MDDAEFHQLLLQARPATTPDSDRLASQLASAIVSTSVTPRRGQRRFLWVAAASMAGLTLSAAGTLAAYQLRVAPFQTLEPGLTRISPSIPADYVELDGTPWHCDAFLEFRDITTAQGNQVGAHIRGQDWSTLGATAYREASHRTSSTVSGEVPGQFYDVVAEHLRAEAAEALPGSVHDNPSDASGAVYSGSSINCQRGRR